MQKDYQIFIKAIEGILESLRSRITTLAERVDYLEEENERLAKSLRVKRKPAKSKPLEINTKEEGYVDPYLKGIMERDRRKS